MRKLAAILWLLPVMAWGQPPTTQPKPLQYSSNGTITPSTVNGQPLNFPDGTLRGGDAIIATGDNATLNNIVLTLGGYTVQPAGSTGGSGAYPFPPSGYGNTLMYFAPSDVGVAGFASSNGDAFMSDIGFWTDGEVGFKASTASGFIGYAYMKQGDTGYPHAAGLGYEGQTWIDQNYIWKCFVSSGAGDAVWKKFPVPFSDDGVMSIVAGTNITVTGTWPNQTINSTAAGVTDGDKSDVTVSASGATWTVEGATNAQFLYPTVAMPANEVSVTRLNNTKSLTGNVTFTLSATPTVGGTFGFDITTDSTARVITLPAGTWRSASRNGAVITTITVPASSTDLPFTVWTKSTGNYVIWGEPLTLNDSTADATPEASDYVFTYDVSAGLDKKALISVLPIAKLTVGDGFDLFKSGSIWQTADDFQAETITANSGFSGGGGNITGLDAANVTIGTLAVTNGGTGITSFGTGVATFLETPSGANLASALTTAIPVSAGGTGFSTYAIGDLIYASGVQTLSKLAGVATGNALISGGVTTAPAWGKITSAHVDSTVATVTGTETLTNKTLTDPIITSYTWAGRPSAASSTNKVIRISDVQTNGSLWVSNGTDWRPVGGSVTLHATGTALTSANNTTEQVLLTVTIPADLLVTNAFADIRTAWSFTNNANAKTVRVRYSGNAGTIYRSVSAASVTSTQTTTVIHARNATNSQVGIVDASGSSGALITSSVDTTASSSIVFSVEKATGTDTGTLERAAVILTYP